MRILLVLDYLPHFAGGMVDHLAALGRALRGADHDPILAFPRARPWLDRLQDAGEVRVMPQITHPLRSGCARTLRQICAERGVDLLHLHFSFALPLALALDLPRWRLPVIYHWHSPPKALGPTGRQGRGVAGAIELGLATAIARHVDRRVIRRHVAISHEIRMLLTDHRWTGSEKIRFVPNAVPRIPAAPLELRGGEVADPIIGSVANFRTEKDHPTLLRAFARLVDRWPQARLVLVGDGPTRQAMEDLAVSLGIERQVRFLGTRSDVGDVLEGLDAFVLSTRYEGHPLALLEAMGYGLPVVAPAVSSIPETVRHGRNGLLFEPGDAASLARHMGGLLEDPTLRARLGRAARETVCEQFPLSLWVERMMAVYEEVARGG